LWVYGAPSFPAAVIEHVRSVLIVDIVPVHTTSDAVNIANFCKNITHVVSNMKRLEFGIWVEDAGLQLVHGLRGLGLGIPIVLFSSTLAADVNLKNQATATAGNRYPFHMSGDSQDLIQFLSQSVPSRPVPKELTGLPHIIWPKEGEFVCSDTTRMYYILGKKLGEGGFAVVHECSDFFGQPFVTKVLKPMLPKQIVEREWRKEKDLLLMVGHPNIVQLYDAFEYSHLFYYIMEKMQGSLRSYMKGFPHGLPLNQVISIGGQILSGLDHIHKQNIVHRDLQIDNILYATNGGELVVKIADFGISRLIQSGEDKIMGVTGRAWEKSPELLDSGITTFQSDIYQLGLILFNLATGGPAIAESETNPDACIRNGMPYQKAVQLGGQLGECLASMLAVDQAHRFKNTYEVWDSLKTAFNHQDLATRGTIRSMVHVGSLGLGSLSLGSQPEMAPPTAPSSLRTAADFLSSPACPLTPDQSRMSDPAGWNS